MLKWDRQHYLSAGTNKNMPHLLFKDGATRLSDVQNVYIVGMMLTIVVMSMTDKGQEVLIKGFSRNGYKNPIQWLNKLRYIFLMLLSYWSWLKKPTYWRRGDVEAERQAEKAIRTMLHKLITTMWPRPRGNGWFKAKVHEQLHVPRDITRNGTPRESFGGPLEHNHIPIKALAQRTQCRRETYDIKLAN